MGTSRVCNPRLLSQLVLAAGLLLAPSAGRAWTPQTELNFAQRAVRFAPKALERQIAKHPDALREGLISAIQNPAQGQRLDDVIREEADSAVQAIRSHEPFEEIVRRIGRVLHYVAVANDPLAVGSSDRNEARYRSDFPRYVESASPRFNVAFYGDGRKVDSTDDLARLLRESFARGRDYYPRIAHEYERIEYGEGRRLFDDRSTAFAIAALAYSHSISDSIGVLRYIWLRGGGADPREFLKLTPPRMTP